MYWFIALNIFFLYCFQLKTNTAKQFESYVYGRTDTQTDCQACQYKQNKFVNV